LGQAVERKAMPLTPLGMTMSVINRWIGRVATLLLDKLRLFTVEAFHKNREDIIAGQQQELVELSIPVVRLWDGILRIPLIGILDSAPRSSWKACSRRSSPRAPKSP
jgi:hypothetical protein